MKKGWILTLLLSLFAPMVQGQLRFKEGTFKIVQFTDVHWNPNSPGCAQSAATIRDVIAAEKPDLALLTGDIVTASPALDGWKSVVELFEQANLPFAVTLGNHDGEVMERAEIINLLLKSPHFVGEKSPDNTMGAGNGILPIYSGTDKSRVAALLYCIDSNHYPPRKEWGTYDWVRFNQIAWYRRQSEAYTARNGGKPLPALAFFHIPLPEYNQIPAAASLLGVKDEGIASPVINSGLFASFIEMGDVMGAFVGHDHDNDFIALHTGIALAFGRVTGTDAYGKAIRGARIIELKEGRAAFDSWITTPAGREESFYYPSGLNSHDEKSMTYLPALPITPTKQGVAYTYYEGKCKHTDQIATLTKLKEGTMANISILEAPAKDHFAYHFRSLIRIPADGVYRFYTFSDDGSKLLIDGQTVVDNDKSHNARKATGTVALKAGFHKLELLYFEDYMGEMLEVGITGRHIPETILPNEMLFLPQ